MIHRLCFNTSGSESLFTHIYILTVSLSLSLSLSLSHTHTTHNTQHTHTHTMQSSSDQTHCRPSCDIRSSLFQCFHPAYVIVWMETLFTCFFFLVCVVCLLVGGGGWVTECVHTQVDQIYSAICDVDGVIHQDWQASLLAECLQAWAATSSAAGKWAWGGSWTHL